MSVETTAVEPTADAVDTGVRRYDFRRPTKLSRDHVRVLEIAFDTFARQWTTLLTTTLRAVSSAKLRSIQQLTYDEYVSSLTTPTTMFVLGVDPLPGVGLLEMSLPSAMTAIDHLLGGPGTPPQPQRPLTEIESTLLQGLVERALGELRYALESLVPLEATVTGIEHNPQFAQAAAPSESVLVVALDLRIGVEECVATLCLPFTPVFAAVERVLSGAAAGREKAGKEAAARSVAARLADAAVDVSVVLGPTRVRMADVVGLDVGHVVRLRHPLSQPLAVVSAGVRFASAVPGREGTRMACLIVNPPEVP